MVRLRSGWLRAALTAAGLAGCTGPAAPPSAVGTVTSLDPRPPNPAQAAVVHQVLAAELRAAEENERPGRRPQLVVLPLPPEAEATDTLFVQIYGDRWCGADGCAAWILSGRAGGWQVVSGKDPGSGAPEMAAYHWGVADQSSAGLPDLIGKAAQEGGACLRFRFDGRRYARVPDDPRAAYCALLSG